MQNRWLTIALKPILSGAMLVVLGLLLVLLILWPIDSRIIQPAFRHLEQQHALDDCRRVQSVIDSELGSLAGLANDWANWDDTYAFAASGDSDYIASNYSDPDILSKQSKIDLLAIYDRQGKKLLYGNYFPERGESVVVDIFTGEVAGDVPMTNRRLPASCKPIRGFC